MEGGQGGQVAQGPVGLKGGGGVGGDAVGGLKGARSRHLSLLAGPVRGAVRGPHCRLVGGMWTWIRRRILSLLTSYTTEDKSQ